MTASDPPDSFLIEKDLVVLGDELAVDGDRLSDAAPTLIRAWLVEVVGRAAAPGQNVTIVANTIRFCTPGACIDTSSRAGDRPLAPARGAGNVSLIAEKIEGPIRVIACGGCGRNGGNLDVWVQNGDAALTIVADLAGGPAPPGGVPGARGVLNRPL